MNNRIVANELMKIAKILTAGIQYKLYCGNSLFTAVCAVPFNHLAGDVDEFVNGVENAAYSLERRVKKFVEEMGKVGYRNVEVYRKPAEAFFRNNELCIAMSGNLHDGQDDKVIGECCKKANLEYVPRAF